MSGGTVYWAEEDRKAKYFVNGEEFEGTLPVMLADMKAGRSRLEQVKCSTVAAAKAASSTEIGVTY